MPNGKTHDKITMVTTPLVGVGTWLVTADIKITAILMFTYFFASIMFNGDLDTNSKPYNRWWLFKMIWIPYQLMFEHRSFWTHGLIVGTVVRLLYLSPIFYLIYVIFNVSVQNINPIYFIPILIGLELGNSIHTISDKISSI